jgi:hypothetical protein
MLQLSGERRCRPFPIGASTAHLISKYYYSLTFLLGSIRKLLLDFVGVYSVNDFYWLDILI